MKCRGKKCNSFQDYDGLGWCFELKCYLLEEKECKLLENISEVRDALIRKCRLFEEVFEIDCSGNLIDEVEKIEW